MTEQYKITERYSIIRNKNEEILVFKVQKISKKDMIETMNSRDNQYHLPILYKLIKRGQKINMSICLMWRNKTQMAWMVGEFVRPWEEIKWKHYSNNPGRKNIGLGNSETPEQQADFELKKEWVKKLEEKDWHVLFPSDKLKASQIYSKSSSSQYVLNSKFEFPKIMLCLKFSEHKKKFVANSIVQPKLDGVRHMAGCKDGKIILITRNKKMKNFFDHVREELLLLFNVLGKVSGNPNCKTFNMWFDGEFYKKGLPLQKINSIASSSKNRHPDEKELKYHIFDICDDGYMSAKKRQELLFFIFFHGMENKKEYLEMAGKTGNNYDYDFLNRNTNLKYIKLVPHKIVKTPIIPHISVW